MATVDGLTLHICVSELNKTLVGGKVDKINQPDRDEIQIVVRNGGKNHRLLICVCPDTCRVQLTETKKPNPIDAPMFCMLLRKHLSGGRIVSIEQPDTDRIIKLEIESTDELYNTDRYYLVCELMGRHSNIILLNSSGEIMESIKRVGLSMSQARIVMPGIKYEAPPTEKKTDPLCASQSDIKCVLMKSGRADKLLSGAFYGVAPVVAMHMIEKAGVSEHTDTMTDAERESLAKTVFDLFKTVRNGEKVYIVRRNEKEQFLPFEPCESDYSIYDSVSLMLDAYYTERDKREYMRRRSYALLHTVEQKRIRKERKLAGFEEAIACEGDYDKFRIYGELITANLYKIKSGQRSVMVENYYDPKMEIIEIPLDEALSAAKNSQKYFKLYKKAKGARDMAISMREGVLNEIEYLRGVEDCIKRADSTEALDEIRSELEEQKYIRHEQGKKRKNAKKQPPQKFISKDGYEIYVGRNNYQNDELTFKIASSYDTWLHVKDRPGSHTVIINKNREDIPESTLYEAARLAAKHSSAGESGAKIEVDYTLCRYVKKPSGALPGKVIYTNQRTVLVIP